jgi:hypothetical protein
MKSLKNKNQLFLVLCLVIAYQNVSRSKFLVQSIVLKKKNLILEVMIE